MNVARSSFIWTSVSRALARIFPQPQNRALVLEPRASAFRDAIVLCAALLGALTFLVWLISLYVNLTPSKRDTAVLVDWDLLTKMRYVEANGSSQIAFSDAINTLNGQRVKFEGFITPLDRSAHQRHFILSPKPSTCFFCMPAGPDEMVEVRAKAPVQYTREPVVVAGTLVVSAQAPGGLYYHLRDGELLQMR
jgi:hypothetical protein